LVYQHPLAYLLGLEGMALLRAFAGEHDREFVVRRFAEIQRQLDADGWGDGVHATPMSIEEGYAQWAPAYDEPGNALLELEQPVVWEILEGLPAGPTLDAACGTGRHTARLAQLGHTIIGVDATPEMLEIARRKVPEADFRIGDLRALPIDDASVDLVVCAIAVSHLPDLTPVFAEFVRVLRPNGHLVLSDSRGHFADIGLPLVRRRDDGSFSYMPVYSRLASDYLAAALPLGLQVRRCDVPPSVKGDRRRGRLACVRPDRGAGHLVAALVRDRGDERRMERAPRRDRLAFPTSVTRGQRDHCVTGLSSCSPSSSRSTRSP